MSALLVSPPPSLVRSGRVIETAHPPGWAFIPRSLPPRLDLDELKPFLEEADRALARYSNETSSLSRGEACERFFFTPTATNTAETIRQAAEPWRSRSKEHELYLGAARPTEAIALLLEPSRLGKIHRDLVDDGELITQRFFRPGQLRQGGAVLNRSDGQIELVHAPHDWIENLLGQLATYIEIAERENTHPLIVAAALHYQIVAIHPFVDGNGRLARYLAELWLVQCGIISSALPLTLIFRRHYAGYLTRLAGVTLYEEWNKWIRFFCAAIIHETTNAIAPISILPALATAAA